MQPDIFFSRIVEPTLQYMAASPTIALPVTNEARVLVTAIAGQESRWKDRRQIGIGEYYPQKVGARGYWQFESTWSGPVAINDVLMSTGRQIEAACKHLDIPCDEHSLYEACAWNDTLACVMARLLLWTHPARVPAVGEKEAAWQYYLRQWRPGAPQRHTWDEIYDQSVAAVGKP
jgi:hypothetical protein